MPGLPHQGVAGSLSAVEAASGEIMDWVMDPRLTLKPKEMWPPSPTGTNQCDKT